MNELPREFDCVIVGTGPTESFISGALSEAGKKCLNLDINSEYGGCRRTLNINDFMNWCSQNGEIITDRRLERLPEKYRSGLFSIDFFPLLIPAQDGIIQILIDTEANDYINVIPVDGLYFPGNGQFRSIPCSKSAIFGDKTLSLKQKRATMKFLAAFIPRSDYGHSEESDAMNNLLNEYADKPFSELLEFIGFDQDLKNAFEYFIAGATDPILTKNAVPKIQLFTKSIGRYSDSPYLTVLYGASDIPQIFSRHSAVYGCPFMLGKYVDSVTKNETGTYTLTIPDIGEITTTHLIYGSNQHHYSNDAPKRLIAHRSVILCTQKLLPQPRSISIIPPMKMDNEKPVCIIQFDSQTKVCDQNQYLLHFISMGQVQSVVNRLLSVNPELSESIIIHTYFDLHEYTDIPFEGSVLIQSPSAEEQLIGMDFFINQSKELISSIDPNIPFYPKKTEVEVVVDIPSVPTAVETSQENSPIEPTPVESTNQASDTN